MKRALLLVLAAALSLTITVGCQGRQPTDGLGGEANSIVMAIAQILETMPEDDPRRPQLVALLEQAGRLRDKCQRVEVFWDLLDKALAADSAWNGGINFKIEAGAGGQ